MSIRELNDALRLSLGLGQTHNRALLTRGVATLPEDTLTEVLCAVREFSTFTRDNDPHGEHDFGSLTVRGHRIMWKIDYYDLALEFGSEDPSDPEKTRRVLTIMLAEEY